ncbi:hypothetical protein J1N35_028017 [Gossypium stocksii]|uniref:Uncharacterized protein n=1 Tax=Gossypium stocksii TaxID=47602 RepID=A0A9D3UV98_9ROSI|nr:hypothetical protein J1N35_028017 [Gossypium stocksii]
MEVGGINPKRKSDKERHYAKFLPQHHLLNADTTATPTASFIACLSLGSNTQEEDHTCLSYLLSACPHTGLYPSESQSPTCTCLLSVLHIVPTVPTSLTILLTSHQIQLSKLLSAWRNWIVKRSKSEVNRGVCRKEIHGRETSS